MSEVSYSSDMPVPKKMNAWVLNNPEELVQIITVSYTHLTLPTTPYV